MNNFLSNGQENNFLHGVQNARNLLENLERSLRKSSKFEMKLLQCQRTHPHSHNTSDWWDTDPSEHQEFKSKKTGKTFRSQVDLAESWSTVSIVCLQYQYEELSKRYEALLQAYDERCTVLNSRDVTLTRMRKRARTAYAQVADAHKVLLNVGEKYLALRNKRNAQKSLYEEKISHLLETISKVMEVAEHARLQFDDQLARCMTNENGADDAFMLEQMRKCNLLFLENLKLKAHIDSIVPGSVNWQSVSYF